MLFSQLAMLAAAGVARAQVQLTPEWQAAYDKANADLTKLSLNDKAGIVTGIGWHTGRCIGNTRAADAIGYPSLCLHDGPLGVRYASSITAFTPGIQAASTWDRDLIRQRGSYLGAEAKGVGVHVLLGPAPGALGKIPNAGRNWEGFSNDPYLDGIATGITIEAMQAQGVQACAKHYVVNEQEHRRTEMSSNVDDRTMHELYLWPFADAVRADVASVMCSYNRINGTYACENDGALNKLLKNELGYPGYVVTDWDAGHSLVRSPAAGLDMEMPGSNYNNGSVLWGDGKLQSAVNGGQVAQSRLDDMVRRILASWHFTGQDDGNHPSFNLARNVQANHKENVRAVARDGQVLLKNTGGILPLKQQRRIAVIGSSSVPNPAGINACVDSGCNNGVLGVGWGSGTVRYPYLSAPLDAIRTRAQQYGGSVTASSTDNTQQAASAASGADVAIVFITASSGEGYLTVEGNAGDRNNLDPWHNGNGLVQAVAGANQNVIVVINSVGPVVLETILAQPNVKGIVWAGLGSQEVGNALVDILWGDTNPNGKLPYTIGKSQSDYGVSVQSGDDNFREGLFIDYRHFDQANIEPRYEFGFGLSYTNYTYSDITVTSVAAGGPATGPIVPGGRADLYDEVATVTARITNSGAVAGAEVAQLYVSYPSSAPTTPPKQLRGFAKLKLAAGASGTATFALRRKDISYWDSARQNWIVPTGQFTVRVGASSRNLALTGTFTAV